MGHKILTCERRFYELIAGKIRLLSVLNTDNKFCIASIYSKKAITNSLKLMIRFEMCGKKLKKKTTSNKLITKLITTA